MTQLLRLTLIAAGMTAFLVLMLGSHLTQRANGTEILLPVQGYDPRDIFLGHYANLRTPLNRLGTHQLEGDDDFEAGDTIYVSLEPRADGTMAAVSLHREHPGGAYVARGGVTSRTELFGDWVNVEDPETGEVRTVREEAEGAWLSVRFNTERYYAPRDRALALQDRLRDRNEDGEIGVNIIAAITSDGGLIIKGLEYDGERFEDSIW